MTDQLRPALSELNLIQNPALGAYALWQFALGYQEADGISAPLPLAFLVLPMVLHRPTLDAIDSTRKASGLALLVAKLGGERENLLAIHERVLLLRRLTLQSIGIGIVAKLVKVEYDSATIRGYPLEPLSKKPILPERMKSFASAPLKLGYWFYKIGLFQVATALGVEF